MNIAGIVELAVSAARQHINDQTILRSWASALKVGAGASIVLGAVTAAYAAVTPYLRRLELRRQRADTFRHQLSDLARASDGIMRIWNEALIPILAANSIAADLRTRLGMGARTSDLWGLLAVKGVAQLVSTVGWNSCPEVQALNERLARINETAESMTGALSVMFASCKRWQRLIEGALSPMLCTRILSGEPLDKLRNELSSECSTSRALDRITIALYGNLSLFSMVQFHDAARALATFIQEASTMLSKLSDRRLLKASAGEKVEDISAAVAKARTAVRAADYARLGTLCTRIENCSTKNYALAQIEKMESFQKNTSESAPA